MLEENCFSAPAWIRTRDHLLKRELLYQLSYGRKLQKDNSINYCFIIEF